MKNTVAIVMQIGLSEYESKVYLELLRHSPQNGYQIARQSGVPRGKVYETLERLLVRGAVAEVETEQDETRASRMFSPVDPDAFLDSIQEEQKHACEQAKRAIQQNNKQNSDIEVIRRITSLELLVHHGRRLISTATQSLHIALWAEEFEHLVDDLLKAKERGIRIALILYSGHKEYSKLTEAGIGAIRHSRSKNQSLPQVGRQFSVAADWVKCITGSIFDEGGVDGVLTHNRGLVTNVVDLVNHEIYVERILEEVGEPVWDKFGRFLGKLDAFESPENEK